MNSTTKPVTHICLLGRDPSANLTPLADRDIPSQRLIICFTTSQSDQLKSLKMVAKTRGIQVDSWQLPSNATTEQLKLSFMQLIEAEHQPPQTSEIFAKYWFNASNGSRQQVLAAYEVMRSYHFPIYIVEPSLDRLCWLYPDGKASDEITDTIKLHEFFTLNGCRLVSQKRLSKQAKHLKSIGENWLGKSKQLGKGLAKLNYLAAVAKGHKLVALLDRPMLADQALQWLLDDLVKKNLIEVQGKKVMFCDQETLFFCSGGWLEQVTYSYLSELTNNLKEVQDHGYSLEVERLVGSQTVLNELDVVALVNNKLFVIECKTKQFERGEANQVLYKLDSLAERLGGIKAKAALVSFYGINSAAKRRARELNIEIIGPRELPSLKKHIERWMTLNK